MRRVGALFIVPAYPSDAPRGKGWPAQLALFDGLGCLKTLRRFYGACVTFKLSSDYLNSTGRC